MNQELTERRTGEICSCHRVADLGMVHRMGLYHFLFLQNCSIRVKSDGHVFMASLDFKVLLMYSPATNLTSPTRYRN